MDDSSVITLEGIIERCLAKHFGQNDVVKALISDNTYNECWHSMIKWIRNELDLGRSVKIPNMGLISVQIWNDEQIVYFKFSEEFLEQTDLMYEELDIKEVRYPTVLLNFWKIKLNSDVNRDTMVSAIQNMLMEIEDIFQTFDNFEMDLGTLGKFFVDEKNLRFLPYEKKSKKSSSNKVTIKNLIDVHIQRNATINKRQKLKPLLGSNNIFASSKSRLENFEENGSRERSAQSIQHSQVKPFEKSKVEGMFHSVHSANKSAFSQNNQFTSPVRRTVKIPEEERLLNDMYGAGADPLALNQNYSSLAGNAQSMINLSFKKPPHLNTRCPPILDSFSRTLASPIASQYNSLSASSRIALFYSISTKYLHFDPSAKGIGYLKIPVNSTLLSAPKILQIPIASEGEEIKYLTIINENLPDMIEFEEGEEHMYESMLDPHRHKISEELIEKIQSRELHFSRYLNYLTAPDLIPLGLLPPIRQYWITNILDLIPSSYSNLTGQKTEEIIDDVLNEINEEYYYACKKSILDYVLKNEEERERIGVGEVFDGCEEWGEGKFRGVEIDESWREEVSKNRTELGKKCVSYCQGTLSIIKVWSVIGDDSFFSLGCAEKTNYFDQSPEQYYVLGSSQEREVLEERWEFEGKWGKYGDGGTLTEFLKEQNEKIEEIVGKIKDNWIPDVARIYQKDLEDMNKEEIITFFRASTCLMSQQIRDLIYKSLGQLRYFFRQFRREHYLDPTECMQNDNEPDKMLQVNFLKIVVKSDMSGITLSNSREQIKSEIIELVDKVVSASKNYHFQKSRYLVQERIFSGK